VKVELLGLLKKLSKVVSRVVKLSFLIGAVDKIGETNRDSSGLNSIRFFPKGFLEIDGILRALVVLEGFSFKISKYFWIHRVVVSFPLVNSSDHLISLIPL